LLCDEKHGATVAQSVKQRPRDFLWPDHERQRLDSAIDDSIADKSDSEIVGNPKDFSAGIRGRAIWTTSQHSARGGSAGRRYAATIGPVSEKEKGQPTKHRPEASWEAADGSR
jgi:hypothetical protein